MWQYFKKSVENSSSYWLNIILIEKSILQKPKGGKTHCVWNKPVTILFYKMRFYVLQAVFKIIMYNFTCGADFSAVHVKSSSLHMWNGFYIVMYKPILSIVYIYFSTDSKYINTKIHDHAMYVGLAHHLKPGRHLRQEFTSEYQM